MIRRSMVRTNWTVSPFNLPPLSLLLVLLLASVARDAGPPRASQEVALIEPEPAPETSARRPLTEEEWRLLVEEALADRFYEFDYDDDGRFDIISWNSFTRTLVVYRNDGAQGTKITDFSAALRRKILMRIEGEERKLGSPLPVDPA